MKRLRSWLRRNGQRSIGAGLPLCIVRHFDRISPQAECYRVLRTTLELQAQSTPFRSLMVTSPGGQEGKTTTLINLAVLFWELGRRVLVVDADLRRGCLHHVFGVPRSPGLTDLVLGKAESLYPVHDLKPGFGLMTRGSQYDKPGVLLGSPALRQALAHLQGRADIILMDSSPLLPVSDSLKLAMAADAVLLVLRAGRSPRRDTAQVRKLLQASRANVLGVVLNGVQDRGRRGYRYDRYYHGGDPSGEAEPLPGEGATTVARLDRFS